MKSIKNFQSAEDKKELWSKINGISFILDLFVYIDTKKERIFDTEQKRSIYECWKIATILNNELHTDDSYKFNNVMKKIKEAVLSLEKPDEDYFINAQPVPLKPIEQTLTEKNVNDDVEKQKSLDSIKSKLSKKPDEVPGDKPMSAADRIREKLAAGKKAVETPIIQEKEIQQIEVSNKKYDFALPEDVQ